MKDERCFAEAAAQNFRYFEYFWITVNLWQDKSDFGGPPQSRVINGKH